MENDKTIILVRQNDPRLMYKILSAKSHFGQCTTASFTRVGSHQGAFYIDGEVSVARNLTLTPKPIMVMVLLQHP